MIKCRLCSKECQDGRGLIGHYRWVHQQKFKSLIDTITLKESNKKRDKKMVEIIAKERMTRDKIFSLCDELKGIRDRLAELKTLNKGGIFSSDEAVKYLTKVLKEEEAKIVKELKKEEVVIEKNESWWDLPL